MLCARVDQGRNTNGATERSSFRLEQRQRSAEPAIIDTLKSDREGSNSVVKPHCERGLANSVKGLTRMKFAYPSYFVQ